jgi:endonuclease/exonuclease/phosphatase (EEP) superfamily protein YafD
LEEIVDRLFVSAFAILLTFSLHSSSAHAKRILFASQFSLIPVSQAHLTIGSAEGGELDPKSIKVLAWNIKKGQERGLDIDLPRLARDRDLVLISEGYLKPDLIKLFESFKGFVWEFGVSFLYKKDHNYETGTMIGSNVNPSNVVVTHTVDMEPIIKTPKALTMAKYPIKGYQQDMLVISVHGINMASHAAFVRHMDQAFYEIDRHDGPVLFAGDFNTRTKKRTTHLFQETLKRGFQSVDFIDGNKRSKGLGGNFLDWSFVRGVHVKNPHIYSVKSSDHQPMHFEMALD